jgi:hypothetical protein
MIESITEPSNLGYFPGLEPVVHGCDRRRHFQFEPSVLVVAVMVLVVTV